MSVVIIDASRRDPDAVRVLELLQGRAPSFLSACMLSKGQVVMVTLCSQRDGVHSQLETLEIRGLQQVKGNDTEEEPAYRDLMYGRSDS